MPGRTGGTIVCGSCHLPLILFGLKCEKAAESWSLKSWRSLEKTCKAESQVNQTNYQLISWISAAAG